MEYYPGRFEKEVNPLLDELVHFQIVKRIWEKDYTVWKDKPDEISNRLGWLDLPAGMDSKLSGIEDFVNGVLRDGFKMVVLLGMGGSSLAPEVFRLTFGVKDNHPGMMVLDTTDPVKISEISGKLDLGTTLFLVSTKSGGTVETLSLMKYFYNLVASRFGPGKAGEHFVAITDPGSKLEQIADSFKFRKAFLNNPDIGGRFSALSYFGLVPAALTGVDIRKILEKAKYASEISKKDSNYIALFGALTGRLAELGADKLTFLTSEKFKYFQAWAEQLIAESTGKEGKGILPVVDEPALDIDSYSGDRVFVVLKTKNDDSFDQALNQLLQKGFPVFVFELNDEYDLGKEFFVWEFATAVAGWVLKIQPFDQPDVESAKVAARESIRKYAEEGKLPGPLPDFVFEEKLKFYGNVQGNTPVEIIDNFIKSNVKNSPESYIAIQAFITPDDDNYKMLQGLREKLTKKYKLACTVGFGPRFLHSTGQLHKGDAGHGIFLQFTYEPEINLPVPVDLGSEESSITFDVLIKAQALGDRQALMNKGRNVLAVDLNYNQKANLNFLKENL